MLGFLKRKKDTFQESNLDGEGKFPPAEDAFKEPTPIENNPLYSADAPEFPSMPKMPSLSDDSDAINERRAIQSERNFDRQPSTPPLTGEKAEVIIAKIDSLKSMIEVLNQRLSNLEYKLGHQDKRW